ncbi:MAG: hypothetical protein QM739_15395 [Propionivibrio sp.]
MYLRVALHAIYVLGLLVILSLSNSKYDWMADIDPSITPGVIEDASGNRAVFLGIILAVVVLAELTVAFKAKKASKRVAAAVLAVVAIAAFMAL